MTKAFETLQEAVKTNKEQIKEFSEQVEADRKEVSSMDEEYKRLILAGKEKEADEYFNKMYEKKRDLERNERKLEVLTSPDNVPHPIVNAADKVIKESDSKREKLQDDYMAKMKELKAIEEDYYKKLEEIGKVLRESNQHSRYSQRAEHMKTPLSKRGEAPTFPDVQYYMQDYKMDDQKAFQAISGRL